MTTDLFNGGVVGRKSKPRCYTTHKPIKLGNGEILGAACGAPSEGYDIYIGFDYGMKFQHQKFPWDVPESEDPVIEFEYHITDMCAPKSPAEFRKMIDWTAQQLDDGKKIHIGCIGGHGRTGTFLAALVSLYEDLTDDPIKWVRENHCKKAVESKTQIKFLVKHFGCKKAEPTKEFSHGPSHWTGKQYDDWDSGTVTGRGTSKKHGNVTHLTRKPRAEEIRYVAKKGSIWG